jgi:hypothetical protein
MQTTDDHRRASVPLPANEARCAPAQPGPAATKCARYLATFPRDAEPADYSANGCTALCDGFISNQALAQLANPRPRKEVAL